MTETPTKRPSADARRAAILRAAAEVFFEQGYAATSIDTIIERIGGSKRNIYNEFGSKQGLFTALVLEFSDAALASFDADEAAHHDLRDTLLHFARRLLKIYMSPELIGVHRIVVTEAYRFPHLARDFYDKGPGRTHARLMRLLNDAVARGEIALPNAATAASHFMGMLRDNFHLQVTLGLRPPPDEAEMEMEVTSAVDIFLDGVRVR